MRMGVDVTRHNDLSRRIDDVVGLLIRDILRNNCDFALSYPDVELAIGPVHRIHNPSVLQNRVESLRSSQVVPYFLYSGRMKECPELIVPG